jgi:hypothetical protein
MDGYAPLLVGLLALLLGIAGGKAHERYKLRDGRWIDRRRLGGSHHYILGLIMGETGGRGAGEIRAEPQ